jgi:PAS domain S-box-containing protein
MMGLMGIGFSRNGASCSVGRMNQGRIRPYTGTGGCLTPVKYLCPGSITAVSTSIIRQTKAMETLTALSQNSSNELFNPTSFFREAVEQSPSSVVITDRNGNIQYVNPKFESLTGYSAEEVLGHNPRVLNSGYTPEDGYRELWKTIHDGHTWRGVFRNRKKNGDIYWEAASISPMRGENGEITHFMAIKEDITIQRAYEDRLRETTLQHGDVVLAYTDAFIETPDPSGRQMDIEGFMSLFSGLAHLPLRELVDFLYYETLRFGHVTRLADDATLVAVRFENP